MRPWKVLAAASAGLLLAGTAAPSAGLAAATTTITSLTVPAAPVDLETSPGAVIRAHIVDSVGVVPGDMSDEIDGATYPASRPRTRAVTTVCYAQSPHLVSGTAKDGEWEFDPFDGKARPTVACEATRIHVRPGRRHQPDGRPAPAAVPRAFRTIGRFGASRPAVAHLRREHHDHVRRHVTLARPRVLDRRARQAPPDRPPAGRVVQEDQAERSSTATSGC
ncbi:hypothetical protein GCM10020358_26420 [Amorphoplanes nipponensis]|uniref:hypothetical protein n=1 Tax=Actinoplanes nipponensis TaxID=135950 RepID=UPI0031ED0F05